MRIVNVATATIITLSCVVIFSNKIAIDPISPQSSVIVGSNTEIISPEQRQEDVEVEILTEEPVIIEHERTIVDGTKKIITKNDRFLLGAVTQYGVTNDYNGAYKRISYPNGDVDISTGVCTDVIVRAFRAVDIDLQKEIHQDMKRNFRQYPKKWGLKSTDRNIDHRRVPNMETYFTRKGYKVFNPKQRDNHENYLPGDLVVWGITDSLTHIGIVSDQPVPGTARHYIIHNPFQGVEISDWLEEFKIINHFRVFSDEKV